jgi:WD40 repeat protein
MSKIRGTILGLLASLVLLLAGLRPSAVGQHPKAEGRETTADVYGDPLPAGAIARLGTIRWRHGDGTTFVAFLPGGKVLLSVGTDATVRQWDVATGKELRRFGVPRTNTGIADFLAPPPPAAPGVLAAMALDFSGGSHGIALAADGKVLAMSEGNAVRAWDVATGKELRKIQPAGGASLAIAISPGSKILATHGNDGAIRLCELATGKDQGQFGKNPGKDNPTILAGMVFSPDGKKLASVNRTNDGKANLFIWDVAKGKELAKVAGKEQTEDLGGVKFSPDGKWLSWIDDEQHVVLADPATGAVARKIELKSDEGPSDGNFVFSPDGKELVERQLVVNRLVVWDVATGKQLRSFQGPGLDPFFLLGGAAELMAFSPDGKLLALGGTEGAISILDFAKGTVVNGDEAHRQAITKLSFGSGSKQVFTTDERRSMRAWDAATGKPIRTIGKPGKALEEAKSLDEEMAAALSDDGRLLATVSDNGDVQVRDAATDKELKAISTGLKAVTAMAFNGDNKLIAIGGMSEKQGEVGLYDVATGKERHRFTLPAPVAAGVAAAAGVDPDAFSVPGLLLFAPDGRSLAAILDGDKVLLWDVATGRELPRIGVGENQAITAVAFSTDGRSLAVDCGDDIPRLFETATGKERRRYQSKTAAKPEPPKEDGLAAGIAQLMDLGELGRMPGGDVAISPDGKLLAHSRPGGKISIWDVAGGKELGELAGHQAQVSALTFAPDGKTLASGSRDTSALLWDVTSFAAKVKPATSKSDAAAAWSDLLGSDAGPAFDAVCQLAAAPEPSVRFLKERVHPAAPVDAEKVQRLLADLDSEQFAVRKKASNELELIGEGAVPLLRKALEADPSAEARRRIEEVLKKSDSVVPSGELLRSLRAVEVLETIGSAEAKAVLQVLAKGTAGASVTRAAQAALDRLGR